MLINIFTVHFPVKAFQPKINEEVTKTTDDTVSVTDSTDTASTNDLTEKHVETGKKPRPKKLKKKYC
jgi:hypothetical protein